jgi:hypothetical protein
VVIEGDVRLGTGVLVGLAILAFAVCLGVVMMLWQRHERERTARQWRERERRLDRRRSVASPDEIRRRRGRER